MVLFSEAILKSVTTLTPSFLIRSASFLQVRRKHKISDGFDFGPDLKITGVSCP